MISDFTWPAWLTVDGVGSLPLNQPFSTADERRYQLVPQQCLAVLPVRSTEDDVPQADGKIPHRRWRSGYGMHLEVDLWESYNDEEKEGKPACDEMLVDMLDTLGLFVNPMVRTGLVQGEANARFIWTPPGKPNRMLDRAQLAIAPSPTLEGALSGTRVAFDIDTPFPYYMEEAETQTTIDDGDTEVILNAGNTDFFLVAKVYGAYTGFTLRNNTVIDVDGNPAELIYNGDLPPGHTTYDVAAPDYIEFAFFLGKGYLNGNGPGRLGGVYWPDSDLFPLVPGANELEFFATDGDADTQAVILSNGAFA